MKKISVHGKLGGEHDDEREIPSLIYLPEARQTICSNFDICGRTLVKLSVPFELENFLKIWYKFNKKFYSLRVLYCQ